MKLSNKLAAATSIAALTLVTSYAAAEDYPYRVQLDQSSRSNGLGVASVPLLLRNTGPGQQQIATTLVGRWAQSQGGVSTSGATTSESRQTSSYVEGANGWGMTVWHDGTNVVYRNYSYFQNSYAEIDPALKLSSATLESTARSFIQNNLPEIALAANEQLQAFKVAYDYAGSIPSTGGAPVEKIVGYTVVFTRTINGVAVVGAGSKVSINIATNGNVWGFDYDWASYSQSGAVQNVLSLASVQARDAQYSASFPGAASIDTKRWECGYFDPGVRRRYSGAYVQAACYWHRVGKYVGDAARNAADPNDGLEFVALADAVPAGSTVQPDPYWPQAQAVLNQPPPTDASTAADRDTVSNGGFEWGTLDGWESTGTAAVLSQQYAYQGNYTAVIGSTIQPGVDSTLSQRIVLPSNATTLSFRYKDVCPDTVYYDQFWVTLYDNQTQTTYTVLPYTCSNNGQWAAVNYSLGSLAGHDVTLKFNHHDDAYPYDISWTLIDSVLVQ